MTEEWKTKLHTISTEDPDQETLQRLMKHGRRSFADGETGYGTRKRVTAGVMALAVFVVALSVLWLGRALTQSDSSPSTGPIPPSVQSHPPMIQTIGYHGLLVTVPSSWKINDTTCGTPVGNTIIRDEGGVASCLIETRARISSVELVSDPSYLLQSFRVTKTFTNPNGVGVQQGTVRGKGSAVNVPDPGVFILIHAPSEMRSIVMSLATSVVDPNGCRMHETQLFPVPYPSSQNTGALIPGSPTAVTICHYINYWLASSASLTGDQATTFTNLVNGLQPGFAFPPKGTYLPSTCNRPQRSGYTLMVKGDGTPGLLWARVGLCGPLGITNGIGSGQLTPALAKALNEPLHHGYAMPGRLVPANGEGG
jgi:hypothetical protein